MVRNPWPKRKSWTKPEAGASSGRSFGPRHALPDNLREEGGGEGEREGRSPRLWSPRKVALHLLSRREHSVAELREKLLGREFPRDDTDTTLAALLEEGLISEDRFVENFVGSYTRRGQGPVRLRAELTRRGIGSEVITGALAAAPTDWLAAAQAVRAKRFGAAVPQDSKERARQARFLQYRGFTAEQARAALQRLPGTP